MHQDCRRGRAHTVLLRSGQLRAALQACSADHPRTDCAKSCERQGRLPPRGEPHPSGGGSVLAALSGSSRLLARWLPCLSPCWSRCRSAWKAWKYHASRWSPPCGPSSASTAAKRRTGTGADGSRDARLYSRASVVSSGTASTCDVRRVFRHLRTYRSHVHADKR